MFSARKFATSIIILITLLNACAKESSSEDRRREENERQFQRLKLADGNYYGYVEIADHQITPVELDLTTTRNPVNGDESPSLSVAMKIGLFGGVVLSSRSASFDSGTGQLSVTFEKQSGIGSASGDPGSGGPTSRSALELRGNLQDGVFKETVLDGPNRGERKVIMAKDGPRLISNRTQYTYNARFQENITAGSSARMTAAQLEIKPVIETRIAPLTSELPILPALDASFKFPGTAIVPQTANDVIYDPLEAYVEFRLHDTTQIRITNVALAKEVLSLGLDAWTPNTVAQGMIQDGATRIGSATIESNFPGIGLTDTPEIAELPPRYFRGTYKTAQNPMSFPAIASLEYLNTLGTNTREYPFATFPKFRLKILICSGGRPYREHTFDMIALDQMAGIGRMWDIRQGMNSGLNIGYTPTWSEIVGRFTTSSTGGVDTRDPQLRMQAQSQDGALDCSDTKTTR